MRSSRQSLLERSNLQGDAFCRALAAAADEWMAELLLAAAGDDSSGVALVAVGGYGRGELCPYSDLDVVLVHESHRDVEALANAVWYPVWDEGIRLDHSVRRPAEVLEVARADLRAQLGLLDGRRVAGDESVVAPLLTGARALWRQRATHWLPILAEHVAERHDARGDVAFLLEPDLKEAHGGLRDVHAVNAAALAVPALGENVDLSALKEAGAVLIAARVELHRATGRATDRLLLQEQDQVAATLGYGSADALMAAIAEAGRTIAWATDDAWRRRSLWSRPDTRRPWLRRLGRAVPRAARGHTASTARATGAGGDGSDGASRRAFRRGGETAGYEPGAPKVVEPGVAIARDGEGGEETVLDSGAPVEEDLTLSLRLAAVAAERVLPIGRASLEALAAAAPTPRDTWPTEMREALVRVLSAGPPAIAALEALDQKGILKRLLPEWETVRNRPQRNVYHLFTVDRHLLETAARAAPLALRVSRPDLLLLGAFLHDIGKGYPGDHTVAGVEVVAKIAARMGLAPADAEVLVALVRNHLLLSELATRRDLDDPATVSAVVEATGDRSRLELLVALTEADSLATGPSAWGPWKAGLVADLAARAATAMAGEPPGVPAPSLVTDRHRALMRQVQVLGRSVVAAEAPGVTVVARDRPGLLAAITGVLALRGLDVRSANAAGEDGFAVDVFTVEPARGRWPDWEQVADELDAVLRGTFPLTERLVEQERVYAGARRAASARPVATQVTVDNAASATCSVVEVRAADSLGLLHRITASLFDEGLDVVAARASTLGHEVVDAFYVRDKSGGKVTDPERVRRIDRRVQAAVLPGT
ncbi:MAG: [protein-PII] uridylyltransferase [Acidimicrobiales bacterium]